MGKDPEWWTDHTAAPAWHSVPEPLTPEPPHGTTQPPAKRRRTWPYAAAVAALAITAAGIWEQREAGQQREERARTAAAYKGRSGAELSVDGVSAELVARWNGDRDRVVIELRTYADRKARYLRLDAAGESARATKGTDPWIAKTPEVAVPVKDPMADVTVRIAVGGATWKEGDQAPVRTVRLSPTGAAYDAETGEQLPSDL
ncbi:hypothetical protein ABZ567_28600 [Streptomyces sp. NPDC016459]|uniref:hypothetical protein n=1 Tax=Streptomyces sp. NPDC016459 TaxID=3157190 RepID=UPI0033D0B8B7